MIKSRYRDYAVDAFRFYGKLHKPKSVDIAAYRLQSYLLENKIKINEEQFTASLADLTAVIQTIDHIKKLNNGESILTAMTVYIDHSGKAGDISAAVVSVAQKENYSIATIDRFLKICRDTFAEKRGLRVAA